MGGGGRVGGVIFMSLLYYMFQSILSTFAFGYFFGVKKLIIFKDAENSAKIINLVFEPFPLKSLLSNKIPYRNKGYFKYFILSTGLRRMGGLSKNVDTADAG